MKYKYIDLITDFGSNPIYLLGNINIWEHKWNKTGVVELVNPLNSINMQVSTYEILSDNKIVRFAIEEFRMNVYFLFVEDE